MDHYILTGRVIEPGAKTNTGHASNKIDVSAAETRQKTVRAFCAERNIHKQDFAELAKVSLSTLYRYLRGEFVFYGGRIEHILKGGK